MWIHFGDFFKKSNFKVNLLKISIGYHLIVYRNDDDGMFESELKWYNNTIAYFALHLNGYSFAWLKLAIALITEIVCH